jgi:hypothetical protein
MGTEGPIHGHAFHSSSSHVLHRGSNLCRINNEHMRTRCLEEINSKAAPLPQQQPTVLLVDLGVLPGGCKAAEIEQRGGALQTRAADVSTSADVVIKGLQPRDRRCVDGTPPNLGQQ